MKGQYKIFITGLAILLSILAAAIGVGLVGGTEFETSAKFLCNFVFLATPLAVIWCVFGFLRKEK